jgi:hypothetical protein
VQIHGDGLTQLRQLLNVLNDLDVNCTKCEFFDMETEKCRKFDARPPAHVIVQGCGHYVMDIPF